MGSGNVYLQPVNTNRNVKRSGSLRSLLLGGILLCGLPFASFAQPTFQRGSSAPATVCQGPAATPIDGYLTVNDPYNSLPEELDTWDIASYPANGGTIGGLPYATTSNGGLLYTSGVTYTPPYPTFTGNDPFVIKCWDSNAGDTVYITINMVVLPLPSFNIVSIPAVCAGATSTVLNYSALSQLGPTTSTFPVGANTWTVPPGVSSITYDVQGGVGGNDSHSPAGTTNPGNGARVQGTLNFLSTGEVLSINVGGRGGNGTVSGATGGFNGGGNASFYFFGCGGAGGGASDIRISGVREVVAGGGGGNGWDAPGPSCGGNGGHDGSAGCNNVGGGHAGGGSTTLNSPGAGATYSGWASGQNGAISNGGNGSPQGISGGGGGGYFGGGGGVWSGGGGGSSYADPSVNTGVTYTTGYNINDGIVSISYNIPGFYTIVWDATAIDSGFTNVTMASFPSSPLTIAVPPTAGAGTYTGQMTITNGTCTSNSYPISITINPIPDVDPSTISNQAYCNTDPTTVDIFTGSVTGTAFNWTNDNPSIGLPASGTGNIGSFSATNTGTSPVTALITVTPTANGCTGAPASFTVTVNPTPMLTSTLTPPAICDSNIFNYPYSGTPTTGTTFTWYRNPISGIQVYGSGAGASGSNNPGEPLDNTTSSPIVVPYTYVLAANGCLNSQNVNVTVNPNPTLSTPLFPGAICSGTLFSYGPTSLTAGVSFMWNRNAIPGISNPAHVGTNNPNEVLVNTTSAPIAVTYTYIMTLTGDTSCSNTQVVTVTVNPTPMLSTPLTPSAICNGTPFTYAPFSATTGAGFAWSRGSITGISNPPNSGIDTINETLNNTTPNPINVVYTYVVTANGCSNSQNVTVALYPTPRLNTALNPTVCDNTVFNYPPSSLTAGTTFTWTRAVVTGISNLAGAGVGNPNETLINTTPNPIIVPYVFALSANGCGPYMQTVNLTVNPNPTLSSTLTPPAICDSQVFSYNPTSNTAEALFTWDRAYIPGIYAVQQTGTGNPDQQLINSTYVVVDVVYTYTITANGCNNVQTVTVPVNPTPKLNPPYTATVCSGSPLLYTPASYTPGATFIWDRPAVTNVSPSSSFDHTPGPGVVNEILTDNLMVPVTTYYYFRLGINGCTNLYPQSVKVTINPTPAMPAITTFPKPNTMCSGTMYQNFGTNAITEGVQYEWTATNAYVFAQGTNHQYALISFNTPGTSVVSVTSNVNNYGCTISNTYTAYVGDEVSETPEVIYYNGQFICLKNDNATYQWGYDDANTLDSTILSGEINQNYDNSSPDFGTKNYWCITTKGDCSQKSYYNVPSGIANINGNDQADLKVYPNPATQVVNVEIKSVTGGTMQVQVSDVLGQKLDMQTVVNNKASFNVANLPAGCYLLECYRDNVKIATTRFIKN